MLIYVISIVLAALLVLSLLGIVALVCRHRKLNKQIKKLIPLGGSIKTQEALLSFATAELIELEKSIKERQTEYTKIGSAIDTAKVEQQGAEAQRALAIELTEKNLELEAAKRRSDFEFTLQQEFDKLSANSPKTLLEAELREVNSQIETIRQTLIVQQEQLKNAAEMEDFIDFHSISLTAQDLKDIELIREFAPKLNRQEAFFKLIWTEFYQKPIQTLCKTVSAEKVRGIYMITNTENQRMYIGQAVDIAARWKEHCKTGLGIGSTSYMINKFYKALHKEGIEKFTFEILEAGDINLNERETYWISFYNATTFGYNSKTGG